ncbi:serine--tRNA ligase [Ornithinimicrobium pratense]|uniref:Serine--tRNA ligase n=1 Tax=Ornithinimicrobium pratense TaxID=2593973 RepID=A0A5J6V1J7_9MICO|nr:serine--tRNA ligase [Ornithinimicrobium pratense]QFG67465.1 serine--tRNA ligase [Ornithinimicrobium pratense]
MLDLRDLRADPDRARLSQQARGADPLAVDSALAADTRHREALSAFETARAEQKAFGKKVAQAQGEEKHQLLAQVKKLAGRVKELDSVASLAAAQRDAAMAQIGNLIMDGIPVGGEDDYVVLEHVGTPRDFADDGFVPKDHLEIGEALGIIDMARGAKVSGARFYYLKGDGARLEHALMGLAQQIAQEEGFSPLVVPNLVRPGTMFGAGFLDEHADEVYHLPADDLYLTGTSEVALAGLHADEIIDLSAGPLRYAATSTCYRREAGSYGKDTKGIFRVHQFQKTEMFVYCRVEDAEAEHANLLRVERRILDALELPYRVIDVAAGDLGGPAARKFDCEAWIPTQERYRELTSTSNCTTFQARRLNTRERDPNGSGTRVVATLNGTAATSTRPIVALLENHQQADGTVRVPEALRPFLGGMETLAAR